MPSELPALFAALLAVLIASTSLADESQQRAATQSVTTAELHDHVATLADDVFEGRGVGTRGGRAAGQYIVKQLRDTRRLQPGGTEDGYFQPCARGGRNILALLPGSDPVLKNEVIVVGAHYDHVGDGRQGYVRGKLGTIYNGADDNASGVASLLETIEAISASGLAPRRSLLFAFWDGEEVGLVGSNRWFESPTISPSAIRLAFNIDMVGRLRKGRLEVLGTRTGYGMRQFLATDVDNALALDFSWELTANSDHWPFLERHIPIVMLHTGLHDDYHQPGDDVEKINYAGLEKVTRYLLTQVVQAANASQLPAYRPARVNESLAMQKRQQAHDAAVPRRTPTAAPPRLGITWRPDEAEPGSVFITHVFANSPAFRAGIQPGDRISALNGATFLNNADFRGRVFTLLDSNAPELILTAESHGHIRTLTVQVPTQSIAANAGK